MNAAAAVEVRELGRVFTPRKREPVVALDGVSLTIPPGEVLSAWPAWASLGARVAALIVVVVAGAAGGAGLALRSSGQPASAPSGGASARDSKTLVGGIFFIGRVPASLPEHGLEAGVVEVYNGSHRWTERVQRGDQFRFSLPPGTYHARAVMKFGTCAYSGGEGSSISDSLVVRKGHVTTANIYCSWH